MEKRVQVEGRETYLAEINEEKNVQVVGPKKVLAVTMKRNMSRSRAL
jgi:hypothetical protein